MSDERRIEVVKALTEVFADACERIIHPGEKMWIAIVVANPDGQSIIRSPGVDLHHAAHLFEHGVEAATDAMGAEDEASFAIAPKSVKQ